MFFLQAGINAWKALEIIFLFLVAATLIITVASIICYRMRNNLHYYLAILAVFCVWPAGKQNLVKCHDKQTCSLFQQVLV